jgi:transposase
MAGVIRLEWGVTSHPTHVGRLCQGIRWSPQKPARRARQRDAAAITRWRDDLWPALVSDDVKWLFRTLGDVYSA